MYGSFSIIMHQEQYLLADLIIVRFCVEHVNWPAFVFAIFIINLAFTLNCLGYFFTTMQLNHNS